MSDKTRRRLVLTPADWPCDISVCPPGLLLYADAYVGMMSEYHSESGKREAYNCGGERLWLEDGAKVTPLNFRWEVIDE